MKDIPLDIYRLVLIHLFESPDILVKVGATSRAFYYETKHILYRDIDLKRSSGEQVLSWANAISNNASLAEIVRTLSFPCAIPGLGITGTERNRMEDALVKAFGAINNLVSLTIASKISQPQLSDFRLQLHSLGSNFRLKTFRVLCLADTRTRPMTITISLMRMHLSEPHRIISLLSRQPEIEELILPNIDVGSEITGDLLLSNTSFLPQLSICELTYKKIPDLHFIKMVSSRPLVRLCLNVHQLAGGHSPPFNHLMGYVGECRQTLLHFRLNFQSLELPLSLAQAVSIISQHLPELKSLYYTQPDNLQESNSDNTISGLSRSLSKFPKLANFWTNNMITDHLLSSTESLDAARELSQSCPSLRRASWPESHGRGSYRILDDDGQVVVEGDDSLNSASWREL